MAKRKDTIRVYGIDFHKNDIKKASEIQSIYSQCHQKGIIDDELYVSSVITSALLLLFSFNHDHAAELRNNLGDMRDFIRSLDKLKERLEKENGRA